jgi:hypothetical protein
MQMNQLKWWPDKSLAVFATILVWLPLLAPFIFGVTLLGRTGVFRFDYLIPAELFPIVFVGSLLLCLVSIRTKIQRTLIGWGFLAAIIMLFGSQGLAVITGVASGGVDTASWWEAIVLSGIILFDLALLMVGVGGVLLIRRLFKSGG